MNLSLKRISGSLFVFVTILFTFFRGCRLTTIITTNTLYLILAVGCFFFWLVFARFKFRISSEDLLLLGYTLWVIVNGVFLTPYTSEAFEYWSLLVSAFAFKVVLQNDMGSCRLYSKYGYISALIITISIAVQLVLPDGIDSLQKLIFGDEMYKSVHYYNSRGYLTGFSMQNAVAVWICAVLLSFLVARILTYRTAKCSQILLLCLCVLAIVLTKKRAVLFAAMVTAYFMYILFNRRKTVAVLKMVLPTIALIGAGFMAYLYIPQFQHMWDKTFASDRALSGREVMWLSMVSMFLEAPVVGVGGGTCDSMYGFGGHNCYLQILGEYGIVGFCLFILAFVVPYIRGLVRTRKFLKDYRYTKEAGWLLAALFMQTVFFIYCLSGNPVFDHFFFTMQFAYMAITQNILRGKLFAQKGLDNERTISNCSGLSGREIHRGLHSFGP